MQLDTLGVARYRIIRHIGSGGMGEVYEVWDERLERRVAVKRLHPHVVARPDSTQLLLHEARSAARIEHPNVVRVYGVEQSGQELLIEMQYIEGRPLNEILGGAALPPELATDLLRQILEGLVACHSQGVIHRDLKPANVLVDATGNVFLTDFGIAQVLRDEERDNATVPAWGTPRFTPPEAWSGGSPTPLWDLYATGIILREALTGAPPFDGETVADVRAQVMEGVHGTISSVCPGLSAEFAGLIDSLCAKDPSARPHNARTALKRLRRTREFAFAKDATADSSRRLVASRHGTGEVHVADKSMELPKRTSKWSFGWTPGSTIALLILLMVALGGFMAMRHARNLAVELPGGEPPKEAIAPVETQAMSQDSVREPKSLTVIRDSLYFAYDDGIHGEEPWGYHEGTGFKLLADLAAGPASSHPSRFLGLARGDYYFVAETPETGRELWNSLLLNDGKFDTPHLVRDIIPGPMGSVPDPIQGGGNVLIFLATTREAGRELWETMGNAEQTAMIADLERGDPDAATNSMRGGTGENCAYWVAKDDGHGTGMGLFRYDFLAHRLELITQAHFETYTVAELHGKAYFLNSDPEHGEEPWVYDTVSKTCGLFMDVNPGTEQSLPYAFETAGEHLFFRATLDETGSEPWISDGTPEGTHLLADINPGSAGSNAFGYVDLGGGEFAFRAESKLVGKELWVSNGTAEGTYPIADINPGPADASPYNVVRAGKYLFFSADNDEFGEELWVAEKRGGRWSARLVADLMAGKESSYPHDLGFVNDSTGYFVANVTAEEGWIYRLSIERDGINVQTLPRPGPESMQADQ